MPIVLPERITDGLINVIQESELPTVVVLHCNHANEIDDTVADACRTLKSAGFTLLNQAVLLKGVNDSATAQINLSEALFDVSVLPYYLHVLDKVAGSAHFSVEETKAKAIMQSMLSTLPGFLVPRLVREISGVSHKVPVKL